MNLSLFHQVSVSPADLNGSYTDTLYLKLISLRILRLITLAFECLEASNSLGSVRVLSLTSGFSLLTRTRKVPTDPCQVSGHFVLQSEELTVRHRGYPRSLIHAVSQQSTTWQVRQDKLRIEHSSSWIFIQKGCGGKNPSWSILSPADSRMSCVCLSIRIASPLKAAPLLHDL